MTRLMKCLVTFGLLACAALVPALAGSLAASSASQSLTTSVGSLSGSVQQSSDSSGGKTALIEGDYRIVALAPVAERPGMLRMKLQAVAERGADAEFFLYVPQAAVDEAQLAQGHVVTARQRPYGFEFSKLETQRAFFLVLTDDWYRELQTNAVVL